MKIKEWIAKRFFWMYFVIISVVFIWQMLTCGVQDFDRYNFGASYDANYEILDGHYLETVFRIPKEAPRGIIFNNFRKNGQVFTDQKLHVDLFDDDSGELVQTTEILLSDEVDERNIFVLFNQKLPAGMKVKMQLWSEGVTGKGPTIGLSDSKDVGSILRLNGTYTTRYLFASLCYEIITYNYIKPVMYFISEILIGFVLLFYKKNHYSILPVKSRKTILPKGQKVSIKNLLFKLVCLWTISLIFLDFVYTMTIEKVIDQREYTSMYERDVELEEENNIVSVTQNGYLLPVRNKDQISQTFYVPENNFSGIGVQISRDTASNGILRCKLFDLLTGDLVLERVYRISELKAVSEYLISNASAEQKNGSKEYVCLDFYTVLHQSKNRYYKAIINMEKIKDGAVSIAMENSDNNHMKINEQYYPNNMKGILLYSNNRFLKEMFQWMVIILMVFLSVTLIVISLRGMRIETMFLISALSLGMIFCVLIPPYCVPDERAHIDSAYRISNVMLGISDSAGPNRVYKRECDIDISKDNTMDVTIERYREVYDGVTNLKADENSLKLVAVWADNAVSNVTKLNYFPAALGFSLGRVFRLNHVGMVLLGRIFTLVISALFMYWGIRKIPFGKCVFALVGLFPITLQQMASCSYDGLILGAAYVFIGYCFSLAYGAEKSILEMGITAYSGAFLATCKGGVYLPLLGLLLLPPLAKKKIRIKELIGIVALGFSLMIVFLAQFSTRILALFSRTAGNLGYRTGSRDAYVELYTLSYFIKQPKRFIRVFQNTFSVRGDTMLLETIGGKLGRLNVLVPWYVIIGFIILILFCSLKRKGEKTFFDSKTRIYILSLCGTSMFLVMLSMLLVWTKIGSAYIEGIQGRYFLPFWGLLVILFRNDILFFQAKKREMLIWIAGILNLFTVGNALLSIL